MQRGQGAKRCAGLAGLRRGDAVEALERFGEAVRRIVAVLHGHVDHLCFRPDQFLGRQRHPARADVVADGQAAHGAEDPLEVEGGKRRLSGDLLNVQRFVQVLLDKIDRSLESFDPALHHGHPFPLQCQYTRGKERMPDILCTPVPGPVTGESPFTGGRF